MLILFDYTSKILLLAKYATSDVVKGNIRSMKHEVSDNFVYRISGLRGRKHVKDKILDTQWLITITWDQKLFMVVLMN